MFYYLCISSHDQLFIYIPMFVTIGGFEPKAVEY